MTEVQANIRNIFFNSLEPKIATRLRNVETFENWAFLTRIELSRKLINENKKKIDDYLDKKKYSIFQTNQAEKEIWENIIKPELEKITI